MSVQRKSKSMPSPVVNSKNIGFERFSSNWFLTKQRHFETDEKLVDVISNSRFPLTTN
jgi:hypothetical protein